MKLVEERGLARRCARRRRGRRGLRHRRPTASSSAPGSRRSGPRAATRWVSRSWTSAETTRSSRWPAARRADDERRRGDRRRHGRRRGCRRGRLRQRSRAVRRRSGRRVGYRDRGRLPGRRTGPRPRTKEQARWTRTARPSRAGVPRASTTAPVPVQKAAHGVGLPTTAGAAALGPHGGGARVPLRPGRRRRTGAPARAPQHRRRSHLRRSRPRRSPRRRSRRPRRPLSRPTGPRRARLLVTRLDPWSVMKTAFMLSISIGDRPARRDGAAVVDPRRHGRVRGVGRTVDDVAGSSTSSFDFLSLVGFSRVMGVALVLTAIEVVLGVGARHAVRVPLQPLRRSHRRRSR